MDKYLIKSTNLMESNPKCLEVIHGLTFSDHPKPVRSRSCDYQDGHPKKLADKLRWKCNLEQGHRKALSPIQVVGNEKLCISEANSAQKSKITKACLKPIKKSENTENTIYEDPVCTTQSVETTCVSTQTASLKCECACHTTEEDSWAEKEAYRLMVQEEVPADYWKDLAEVRRAALEEALIENKELHEKLSQLEMEKDALSELASHADYFASMLKKAINYDDSGIVADETINSQVQDDTEEDFREIEDDEEEEKKLKTTSHEN